MTTISVVSAIWGDRYRQFLPRWWDSVQALERQPEQVVIITDRRCFELAHSTKPFGYKVPTKILGLHDELTFNEYYDRAYQECEMEWLAICCIDDVFVPEALNDIDKADEAGCEMVADGVKFTNQSRIWKGYWNPSEIYRNMTMPGAAPMKKSMYERVGWPKDIYWSDWAFYMKCAKAGVKVYQSDLIRIIFDEGYNHKTQSGQQLDPDTRAFANQQIGEFAAKLQSEN
jgi:hypothetical protein